MEASHSLTPLGMIDTVERLTKKDVEDFVDDHYKAARMVLTGVGGVDHDQLTGLAKKHFGDVGNKYARAMPNPRDTQGVRFTGSELMYRDDYYPYLFAALAVEGVSRSHSDYLPLQIASQAVGQWDRTHRVSSTSPSKVVQLLDATSGLQSFENFSLSYNSTGLFGVYFVADGDDEKKVCDVLSVLQGQWKHLAYGVTKEELNRAKNSLVTNLFLELENNSRLANHVATEVLSCGKITPLHQLERKIHYTDVSTVRDAVMRHVYDRDIACAGIGLTEAWPEYMLVRGGMSWWRL